MGQVLGLQILVNFVTSQAPSMVSRGVYRRGQARPTSVRHIRAWPDFIGLSSYAAKAQLWLKVSGPPSKCDARSILLANWACYGPWRTQVQGDGGYLEKNLKLFKNPLQILKINPPSPPVLAM